VTLAHKEVLVGQEYIEQDDQASPSTASGIGDQVEMIDHQPFDGPCEIRIDGDSHNLGLTLTRAIRVRPTR
jgi:hypothetical protein